MNRRQLIPWQQNNMPLNMFEESPFQQLWQDMNRTFSNFFNEFGERPFAQNTGAFSPSLNMTENDTAFKVEIEIPGVAEDDVDITLTHNMLTIKGEKKAEQEEKKDNYYHLERHYGSFYRNIPLPPNMIDQDNVLASYDKGILTITLPKLEEAQQIMKRIEVKTG